ncbi:MAG: DUF423 domain-containing protein [Chitinophagaceae bacterium]|jgi:uncharacterized membrane protein YgdD (TMEM256/DUF423 family)|nr:DUF423 domain-containing protein [Chitinophagaceae bacterium]
MRKIFLLEASVLGALSVAMGAFAAHGLKQIVPEHSVSIFETGVRYQFYHVFALALCGIVYQNFSNKAVLWAGNLFLLGILFFSGSLYALTFTMAKGLEGFGWLGPVTPIGGVFFIAGWISLAIGIGTKQREK